MEHPITEQENVIEVHQMPPHDTTETHEGASNDAHQQQARRYKGPKEIDAPHEVTPLPIHQPPCNPADEVNVHTTDEPSTSLDQASLLLHAKQCLDCASSHATEVLNCMCLTTTGARHSIEHPCDASQTTTSEPLLASLYGSVNQAARALCNRHDLLTQLQSKVTPSLPMEHVTLLAEDLYACKLESLETQQHSHHQEYQQWDQEAQQALQHAEAKTELALGRVLALHAAYRTTLDERAPLPSSRSRPGHLSSRAEVQSARRSHSANKSRSPPGEGC